MGRRLSGRDYDFMLGDLMIHVETMSATIDDAKGVAKTKGVPNGKVNGEVSCSGELEVDTQNYNLIIEAARKAGSFEDLEDFDMVVNGEVDEESSKHELFGCSFRISELLNIDTKGGEKTKHKLPFDVTSPDFVKINGVPYLSRKSTENIR